MKLSPRPWCRPGTQCAAGTGMAQHHRLPHRSLTRRGLGTLNCRCTARAVNAPKEISAVPERMQGVTAAPRPLTPESAGALLLRNLEPGLAQLPAKQRDVLILVWLEGMSYEQAAKFIGISVGTVKSRLTRALEQLHRWLASVDDAPPPSVH